MGLTLIPLPPHLQRKNLERRLPQSPSVRDRTGEILDGCEILGFVGVTRPGFATWLFRCRCGQLSIATSAVLYQRTQGCGCRGTKHGLTRAPIYSVWRRMIASCYDAQSPSYHRYGAQGVTVCRRWKQSAGLFAEDMGPRPSASHRLELVDQRRGFCPGNVCWMIDRDQRVRRGEATLIAYNGAELTIAEWSRRTGLSRQLIGQRVAKCRELGADLAEAVATPVGVRLPCMARKLAARKKA